MTSHFASFLNKTNIFHVVVDLYSNRSIDQRRPQNVLRKSMTHSAVPHVPLLCSYLVLMLCVMHY